MSMLMQKKSPMRSLIPGADVILMLKPASLFSQLLSKIITVVDFANLVAKREKGGLTFIFCVFAKRKCKKRRKKGV